jgi:poly(3-hydroxybutyrate) depolymerase
MSICRAFPSKFAFWLAALVVLLLPLVSHAGLAGIDVPGSKRLTVADWGGAPITLWYLRGADTKADAPIVFVMHGVGRDADRYLAEWRDIALANDIVVVVPEYAQNYFPGSEGYNFGGVFDEAGSLQPKARWAYSSIEPLFDALRRHENLSAEQYWLFGHSAGAQFVHRFVMLGVAQRMVAAISANAGSYMFPVNDVDWPFGLRGAPKGGDAGIFASPMVLMLGDADSDPNHRSLPRQPAAMAQGPHRYARGQNFYGTSRKIAERTGQTFNWSCVIVPGVAHDNAGIARAAISIIKGWKPTPGADCAP